MLLIYLSLALGVSFLCSLFEAVILSVSPAYATTLAKDNKFGGKLLQSLKKDLDQSLTAILTLNTIAHTVGAVGVGAEVLRLFGDEYVALGSIVLTILVLVLSEIIPKSVGAYYWRLLAPFVAYGVKAFIYITYPVIFIMEYFSKFFASSAKHHNQISKDEILYVAEMGSKEGTLSEDEIKFIRNVFRLRSVRVSDIMTPRTVVLAFQQDQSFEEVREEHKKLPFSRIPTFGESIDEITGVVMRYELLEQLSRGNNQGQLKEILHPLHAIPPFGAVADALKEFLERKEHIFAVIDEHGGFAGIVTLEDCLETLLGIEIIDEFDSVEDMRKFARDKWKKGRVAKEWAKAKADSSD